MEPMRDDKTQPVRPPVFRESSGFAAWLASTGSALAFTARRVGKAFLVGVNEQGGVSLFERTFEGAAGLAAHGGALHIGCENGVWRLEALQDGAGAHGYDRVYAPQEYSLTGNVSVHEMAVCQGELHFLSLIHI